MTDSIIAPDAPALIAETCQFWMIWTKSGRVPRFVHNTYASAEAECERLARLRPGHKFIILEATSKRHIPAPEVTEAEQDAQASAAMASAA